MKVHPAGSPLSSLDSGRPGDLCGCGLSCERAFYDITNLFSLRTFAVEISKKRGSNRYNVSWYSIKEEYNSWLHPEWINWRHCKQLRRSWPARAIFQQSVYAQVPIPAFSKCIFTDALLAKSKLTKFKFVSVRFANFASLGQGGSICSEYEFIHERHNFPRPSLRSNCGSCPSHFLYK